MDVWAQDSLKSVSRETMAKLEQYQALLVKWQGAINLVSNTTIAEAKERHFADSAQLAQYIPEGTKTMADIGSGAGFPGLVLAIMRPDIETHLVESDERKVQFLRTVSRETMADVTVHDQRIEDVTGAISPDLITVRALASLEELCAYVLPWAEQNPALQMLFMKGEKAEEEIAQAQQSYQFDLEIFDSITDPKGKILRLSALKLCA